VSGSSGAMSGLSIEARIVVSSLFCGMIFRKGLKRTAFMSFLTVGWRHAGITDVPYGIIQLSIHCNRDGESAKSLP
jgi:hypothetical protein